MEGITKPVFSKEDLDNLHVVGGPRHVYDTKTPVIVRYCLGSASEQMHMTDELDNIECMELIRLAKIGYRTEHPDE